MADYAGVDVDHGTVARFWSKVNHLGPFPEHRPELGPCWAWTGAPGDNGYAYFWYDGKKRLAHRFSYELFIRPIPEGLTIDHLCRNTICVNPAHLEPVTSKINILRGDGPAARNVLATECFMGHPFDEANTYLYPNGERGCRECQRRRVGEWRQKNAPPSGLGKGWRGKVVSHCPAGHEYTPENTYVGPDGGRDCRTCVRKRNREYQRRKRAAVKAAAAD